MSLSDFGHAIPQGKSAGTQDASAGVDKGVYGTAYKSAYGSESSDWSGWTVPCDGYDPADEGRREAIFALGNGLFVTRAATTFSRADNVHYPGTYRAGCYDRAESYIAGQQEVNVSLVNLPNWLPLDFSVQDGPWFSLDEVCLQDYCHSLDMRRGVAIRRFAFTDKEGRQTQVVERRLVSMAEPHLAAVQLQITPQNWHGRVKVRSCLDGGVRNDNVPRYGDYQRCHLHVVDSGASKPNLLWLQARTQQTGIDIAEAAALHVATNADVNVGDSVSDSDEDNAAPVSVEFQRVEKSATGIQQTAVWEAECGRQMIVEKIAAIFTSEDPGVDDAGVAAREALASTARFAVLLEQHAEAWRNLWQHAELSTQHPSTALILRFHMFHLLQTVSPHTTTVDAGVPARGWHGEGYRGHIFWDELFVFPFLNFRFPDVARALLLYRYRRLDAARAAAEAAGFKGAMFPWRSGHSGREVTPEHQKNLLSGHWLEDPTRLQRHIGSAVAYNVWHYFLATGDDSFLADFGAEMVLEVAHFWSSAAQFNAQLQRYEIKGVIGPDEYHTAYPGQSKPGLDNNAYTNLTAVWTLCCALNLLEHLPSQRRSALLQQLKIDDHELSRWEDISRRMRVAFHDDGIISQFEGFAELDEFDRSQLPPDVADKRIDWALEAVGETADAYQVTKQADTLTLFYLFPQDEMERLLARLGYRFTRRNLLRTANYYLARTMHRSSLSRVAYAGALAQVDPQRSWEFFKQALETDLHGLKGESIAEGIHLGAMGGTLDVLQRRYLGIAPCVDGLRLTPAMPPELGTVELVLNYRGNSLRFAGSAAGVRVISAPDNAPVNIIEESSTQGAIARCLSPGASLFIAAQPLSPEDE